MKHLSLFLAAAVSLGAASLAVPANAAPTCCVGYYDHEDAKQNTNNIISTLTDKINAMQLAIIEAMRLGTGQLSGNSKEQIGAQSNMANVNDDRRVVGNVEMARFNAIRSAASGASSCNTTTAGIATGGLNKNVASLSASLTTDMVKWDLGGDDSVPSARGTDVAVQALLQRHCSLYANNGDKASGLCASAASGDLMDADVDIGKSLYAKMNGTEAFALDQQRLDAAKTFLIQSTSPRPQGAMLPQEATSQGGREKAAARHAAAARLSIAKYAMADVLARRSPQDNQQLTQWARGTAQQITGYEGAGLPNGASWTDAMDIKARSWYQNANWGTAVASQSAEQATKDSAAILAYQAYVQWELYKLVEKQNMMLAAMLALQTENSRAMPAGATR